MAEEKIQRLCHKTEVLESQPLGFNVGGWSKKVILIKKDGVLYGWLDSCPHYTEGTPLAWKENQYLSEDANYLKCFAHGAHFEIKSGLCIKGPCIGKYLERVKIAEDDYGYLYVHGDL